MSSRHGFWISLVVLLLASLSGCGDDDGGDGDEAERKAKPVAGTFVGKAQGSEAFVAVVAAPPTKGQDKREVSLFVCDAERLCESFSGSASGNDFTAEAEGEGGEARATLTAKTATGRVEVPGADTVRYRAATATATAGVYDLTVSANGRIRGASAAGVGLEGQSTLPRPGSGSIKLADGRRLKFDITRNSSDDPIRLAPGEMRLIVLEDGQLKGAAKSRPAEGGDASDFFVLSAPK